MQYKWRQDVISAFLISTFDMISSRASQYSGVLGKFRSLPAQHFKRSTQPNRFVSVVACTLFNQNPPTISPLSNSCPANRPAGSENYLGSEPVDDAAYKLSPVRAEGERRKQMFSVRCIGEATWIGHGGIVMHL